MSECPAIWTFPLYENKVLLLIPAVSSDSASWGTRGKNEEEGRLSENDTEDEHTASAEAIPQMTAAAASLGFSTVLSSSPPGPLTPKVIQRFRSSGTPGFGHHGMIGKSAFSALPSGRNLGFFASPADLSVCLAIAVHSFV